MKPYTMHVCEGCEQLRNCINGKYCLKLHKYVEWSKKKDCV